MTEPAELNAALIHAIAVAQGIEKGSDDASIDLMGGWNSYNSRGRGKSVLRRVYRAGKWEWVAEGKYLSKGRYLAADRQHEIWGEVYPGDIIAQGYGSDYDICYIVTANEKPLHKIEAQKRKSGNYLVTLPDGSTLEIAGW